MTATTLTANELKTRGVSAIESLLCEHSEAIISVRGSSRYVVMEMSHYQYLRECELDAALAQSKADLAAGLGVQQTAAQHMAEMEALLSPSKSGSAASAPKAKTKARRQPKTRA